MGWGIELMTQNIGLGVEHTILLILVMGSIIFMAKDFQLGLVMLFVTSSGVFVWFYQVGLNYALPLTVFFISLIMLSLSLYATNKTSKTGGFS